MMLRFKDQIAGADKESCVAVVHKMVSLSKEARSSGILGLEAKIAEEPNIFLKTGMGLILDGTDPERVKDVLFNLIAADKCDSTELLAKLIMAEGVLDIQHGENPRLIAVKLGAMLGEQYLDRFVESAEAVDSSIKEFWTALNNKKCQPESKPFEERLLAMRQPGLTRLVADVPLDTLTLALCGCSGQLLYYIAGCVSNNTFLTICEGIKTRPAEYVFKAQQKVLATAESLRKQGLIFYE